MIPSLSSSRKDKIIVTTGQLLPGLGIDCGGVWGTSWSDGMVLSHDRGTGYITTHLSDLIKLIHLKVVSMDPVLH